MATHSSILAWKIPWTEEPGRLQSKGSLRVGHDWATSLSLFTFMHWRRKWQPTPVFLPGESQGQRSHWAAIYGVAQSRTRLKWLSGSRDRFQYSCLENPWTEKPGRLQSMGSLRVRHDWATSLSLFHFHALEKEMAIHSSVLAWRIPGTGEPGGLPSMGSHRVGHDWSDLTAAAAAQGD